MKILTNIVLYFTLRSEKIKIRYKFFDMTISESNSYVTTALPNILNYLFKKPCLTQQVHLN